MEIPHLPHDDETPEPTPSVPPRPARRVFLLGPVLGTLRHRWPEYLLEILVIVFSISISFALDQWKERRHEHEVEQLYLKTLAANLTSDIDSLHEIIPETRQVIERARALIVESQHPAVPPPTLDADIQVIVKRPAFVAHDVAFSDLRSSGNLRVLHDFRLKNALFAYYGDSESIQAKQAAEREVMITLVAPYILKKMAIGGPRPVGAPQATASLQDLEFSNSMWARLHDRQELLGDYERELDLAQRIQQRIERELE